MLGVAEKEGFDDEDADEVKIDEQNLIVDEIALPSGIENDLLGGLAEDESPLLPAARAFGTEEDSNLVDEFDETMKTPTAYSQTAGVESIRAMQLAIHEPLAPGVNQSADKANKKTAVKKVEENDEGQLKIVEEVLGDAI